MTTLVLSGWGQPSDALREIAPDGIHLDYTRDGTVKGALNILSTYQPERVIGWSMGGQLAIRAIDKGIIRPKQLVLIGTPYQFIRSSGDTLGMGELTFQKYRDNYQRDPDRTLRKSYALIAHGDSKADILQTYLSAARKRLPERNWLYWLDSLSAWRADQVDFNRFPPTLLIHGLKDAVIAPEQSQKLYALLPHAALKSLPDSGHAPHWHDTATVTQWIHEHAQ